ncbi:amino acid permease-domain-containing protein [Lasiosphaeris hirsuta]|uniref:Amino acid permease-domain-containing protein n=1 Tax=Lasiosphaeris hirsuta TaxID=260670 RepID=A0AA40A119_9PEZI|nr:amino acid permease-domain-containing protein [Lasiosphaeris hirsuta]
MATASEPNINTGDTEKLRQNLRGVQVFFILVSTIIGTGVFSGNAIALTVAGPVGLLVNVLGLGLVAICVGETVSEFVQLWAVPNAVYYYIKYFIDDEAAWVVTILYWYSNATVFAVQMLGAAKLVQFWSLIAIWPPFIFFLMVPFILLAVNLAGIKVYGWVETVFGMLKTVLVFGVTCTLYDISTKAISAGFQYNKDLVSSKSHAFFYGIPYVAYSYIGIESSIVAAFEARSATAVALPSRLIHWFIVGFYFLCTLGLALTVPWNDPHLTGSLDKLTQPRSNSATIIAIARDPRLGGGPLAGFVNGCLIMSIVSSAAASLYLASRTLYGLAYTLRKQTDFAKGLSSIWGERAMVPARALLVTFLAFFWLPWISQIPGNRITVNDVLNVMSLTASASCVITWAFICLAFIRFERFTESPDARSSPDGMPGAVRKHEGCYARSHKRYAKQVSGLGVAIQPWFAWAGFLGCIIVFISASAPWWSRPATPRDVIAAYGPVSFFHSLLSSPRLLVISTNN